MNIFKSSKSIKGCAAGISFNSKEQCLFIQLVKQTSYNEETRLGSFAGGEKVTIKSSKAEIGSLLDVLRRNVPYSTVHRSRDAMTQIYFEPYFIVNNETQQKEHKGYGLRVIKKSQDKESKFLMSFNFGEAELLRSYLNFALDHMHGAEYAAEKKRYSDKLGKKKDDVIANGVDLAQSSMVPEDSSSIS